VNNENIACFSQIVVVKKGAFYFQWLTTDDTSEYAKSWDHSVMVVKIK